MSVFEAAQRPTLVIQAVTDDTERLTRGIPNAKYSDGSNGSSEEGGPPRRRRSSDSSVFPEMLLDKYAVGKVIGRGASSEVFAATEKSTQECAAVKRVHKRRSCVSARATRRLRDEVRVLSSLKHPHIVEMREVPNALDYDPRLGV